MDIAVGHLFGELAAGLISAALTSAVLSSSSSSNSVSRKRTKSAPSPLFSHTPRVVKSGYFFKEGHYWKNWKLRWFVLRGSTITYHQSKQEDEAVLGSIQVENAHVHVVTSDISWEYGERECLVIEDTQNGKTFRMFPYSRAGKAAARQQINEWLTVLEKHGAIPVQGPAQDSVSSRKESDKSV